MNDNDWVLVPGEGMGPFVLNTERLALESELAKADIELDSPEDEPTTAECEDGDIELTFDEAPPHHLRQIIVMDDRVVLNGEAIISRRPQELLDAWRISDGDTLWRRDAAWHTVNDPAATPIGTLQPATDKELLTNGTLWIPRLGIGLQLNRGEVECVVLRPLAHVPAEGNGSLTSSQRSLLSLPDLSEAFSTPPQPASWIAQWLYRGLAAALVISLGFLGLQSWKYQQQWNVAPVVEGEVIAVRPPPPANFPDEFTIAYQDLNGQAREVIFRPADVYVLREVGEKVAVRFLPEAPDQPLGPARVQDAAFLVYAPVAIGVFAVYLVLNVIVGIGTWVAGKSGRPDAV